MSVDEMAPDRGWLRSKWSVFVKRTNIGIARSKVLVIPNDSRDGKTFILWRLWCYDLVSLI